MHRNIVLLLLLSLSYQLRQDAMVESSFEAPGDQPTYDPHQWGNMIEEIFSFAKEKQRHVEWQHNIQELLLQKKNHKTHFNGKDKPEGKAASSDAGCRTAEKDSANVFPLPVSGLYFKIFYFCMLTL